MFSEACPTAREAGLLVDILADVTNLDSCETEEGLDSCLNDVLQVCASVNGRIGFICKVATYTRERLSDLSLCNQVFSVMWLLERAQRRVYDVIGRSFETSRWPIERLIAGLHLKDAECGVCASRL